LPSKLILEQLIELVGGKHNLKYCKMVEEDILIQRGGDIRKSKAEEALGANIYADVVRYYRDNEIVQGRCTLPSKLILEQLIERVGGKHNLKYCKMVEEAIFLESLGLNTAR
jgi:hypothetical protein